MKTEQKLALLRRLLEQSEKIAVENSSDPTFKTWKNNVERTLIRVFGLDSPEVKQFTDLRFFYRAIVIGLGKDHSNKHREVFKRDFKVAISSIRNYIEEIEEYGDETDSGAVLNRPEFANDIEVHVEGEDIGVPASRPEFAKVFISHSSKDAHYVEELVESLEIVGLPSERIFCTSFEGYGIRLGEDFLDAIKDQLNDETLVLFVLSKNFYASPVCLCEMGAAWVQSKEHIPILVPPFDFKDIEGVIPLTQGFKINEPLKLNLFKEKVESLFNIEATSSVSSWERKRDRIISRINGKIERDAKRKV